MSSKEFKKMMARKMMSHKIRTGSKELSHEWFKAKVNKKKLPDIPEKEREESKYRNMTIAQWEKKYL